MEKDYFISSNGQRIDYIKGWFEQDHSFPYGITTFKDFVEKCFNNSQEIYPKSIEFFINKLAITQFFIDTMSEHLSSYPKWENMLDIGTGPAIHPRVLKMLNYCDRAYGIDISSRNNDYPDEIFRQYCDLLYNIWSANEFSENKRATIAIAEELFRSVGRYECPFYILSLLNKQPEFSMSKYIVDNFMKWEASDLKYDLITGFMCIEYFEVDSFLEKISKLLNKGGVFYFIVDYWYGISGCSMHLPMDAPWLHARMSVSDLKRYYKDDRSDIYEYAKQAIYFESSHLTAIDYINTAKKHNLDLVLCMRSFKEGVNSGIWKINGMTEYFNKQVLPQSKMINPNVTAQDLFTKYLTMAFVKN